MNRTDAGWWVDDDREFLLERIASRISGAESSRDVLNEAVACVTSVLDCDACEIYLLEGEDLVLRASSGNQAGLCHHVTKRAWRDIRWAEGQWEPIVVPEMAYSDARGRAFKRRGGEFFEAVLSVPVVASGRLVGVINAQSHARRRYTEDEINVISTLSFLVGLKIEVARLNRDNASLVKRLESQGDIEKATRILQADLGLTQRDAYLLLQRQSRDRRKPMKDVAAAILLSCRLKNLPGSDCEGLSITPKNPELLS
jgi:uroporphyrinogen-III synthase